MTFSSCSARSRLAGLALAALLAAPPAVAAELPELKIDLAQTTVSGISSGAFMAVQLGVAHSASVRGVAATAGGPYFCALDDALGGASVDRAIGRCMQGDPAYRAQPIDAAQLARMVAATRGWGAKGEIDPPEGLARQTVWIFHGYNDGVVKKPVSDALRAWYTAFTPAGQVFYKDELPAGHAQISAACADRPDGACNVCAQTGGRFINACAEPGQPGALYDAAGAALQLFYGPLRRTPTAALGGKLESFEQAPFIRGRSGSPVPPARIAMGDTGYVYVPPACRAGEPCRLHIAFHGCQQDAGSLGQAFATTAGFNEWADAGRIVVLYPQARKTLPDPLGRTPANPMGCWDWWGYNDFLHDPGAGTYARKAGVQIAAVWRMAERLAGGGGHLAAEGRPAPVLRVVDRSAAQVALAWTPVAGATGYIVERAEAGGEAQPRARVDGGRVSWVDDGLRAESHYRYTLRPLAGSAEGAPSAPVEVHTAASPPACDPYFSLARGVPVTRSGRPTQATCP